MTPDAGGHAGTSGGVVNFIPRANSVGRSRSPMPDSPLSGVSSRLRTVQKGARRLHVTSARRLRRSRRANAKLDFIRCHDEAGNTQRAHRHIPALWMDGRMPRIRSPAGSAVGIIRSAYDADESSRLCAVFTESLGLRLPHPFILAKETAAIYALRPSVVTLCCNVS